MPEPVKVLYEYYTCNHETPRRCRRRATVWMDGLGFCDEHEGDILRSLERFKMRIEYRVSR